MSFALAMFWHLALVKCDTISTANVVGWRSKHVPPMRWMAQQTTRKSIFHVPQYSKQSNTAEIYLGAEKPVCQACEKRRTEFSLIMATTFSWLNCDLGTTQDLDIKVLKNFHFLANLVCSVSFAGLISWEEYEAQLRVLPMIMAPRKYGPREVPHNR